MKHRKTLKICDEKISKLEAIEKNIPVYKASPKQFKGKKFEDFLNIGKNKEKIPIIAGTAKNQMIMNTVNKFSLIPVSKVEINQMECSMSKRQLSQSPRKKETP